MYENVLAEEAAPALPAPAGFVPYEGEFSEFVTYDDDKALGSAFPDTKSMEKVNDGADFEFGTGKPAIVVFFAKYIKYEAFAAVEAASAWADSLGLQGVGVLLDHKKKDATRFVEKAPCKCTLSLYWDNGWVLKNLFQDMTGGVLTTPQLMLIDGEGNIAWRQALSGQTGTMTLSASQFDIQVALFAAGKKLGSHGSSGVEEDNENYDDVEAADVFDTVEVADAAW